MLCLFCAYFCFFAPPSALAHSLALADTKPVLDVSQANNTLYREDSWLPIQVKISQVEAPLSGLLVAQTCNFVSRDASQIGSLSPWRYQVPVHQEAGTAQTYTIPVSFTLGNLEAQSVLITLLDAHGKVLAQQVVGRGYTVAPSDLLIGALSDQASDLSMALVRVTLTNQKDTATTVPLDASTFPTQSSLLSLYTMLIFDNFSTSTLSPAQLLALRTWVNRGGVLLEIGGPQWQRTLSPLPTDLLPVVITGTQTMPANVPLFPITIPSSSDAYFIQANQAPGPLSISTSTLQSQTFFDSNTTQLSYGRSPLIAKARLGEGTICYLAFNPVEPALLNWSSQPNLWQSLLFSSMGAHFLIPNTATAHTTGPGDLLAHIGIMRMIAPEGLTGPWLLLVLLLVYLLFLGPIRLLLIRYLQPASLWRWRLFFAGIFVFSLATYSLSFYQQVHEVSDNTVSLIRLNQDGHSAHITSYHGIFSPSTLPLTLQFSGENLVQPPTNSVLNYANLHYTGADTPFSSTMTTNENTVQLANTSSWLMHPLVTEQDTTLQGRLSAQISFDHGALVGKISNTLPGAISDLYILLPHGFARIGALAAGETRDVHLTLVTTSDGAGSSLANAMAQRGGLTSPYFPYTSGNTPGSDFEHHMALLSALNGTGTNFKQCENTCNRHAITEGGTFYFADSHLPNPSQIDLPDPLLLSNAPATMIGWIDQQGLPSGTTAMMNNSVLSGRHENFFQMPISLHLTTLDHLPAHLIQGQVIDIAGFDAQMVLPGIYTFSEGGLTFEFPVSQLLTHLPDSLTLSIPDLLASPRGLDRLSNLSNLQALLYNWQTHQWDTIQMQQNSFSSRNTSAYLGRNAHILLHISNDSNNLGHLIFGTPFLSFQ